MVFHCQAFGQTLFARFSHRTFYVTNTTLDENVWSFSRGLSVVTKSDIEEKMKSALGTTDWENEHFCCRAFHFAFPFSFPLVFTFTWDLGRTHGIPKQPLWWRILHNILFQVLSWRCQATARGEKTGMASRKEKKTISPSGIRCNKKFYI